MKQTIRKFTALLLVSAGAVALAGLVGFTVVLSSTPTIVRAENQIATICDRNGNVYASLAAAYTALPNGGEIVISNGTLSSTQAKVSINNSNEYSIIVEGNVTILSDTTSMFSVTAGSRLNIIADNASLIIDGNNSTANGQLFAVNGSTLSLYGSIIIDGITDTGKNGPVLTCTNSTIDLNGVVIRNCSGNFGGTINANKTNLTLSNCTISNNTAAVGGALRVVGGSLVTNGCIIDSNIATGVTGGAAGGAGILVEDGANCTLTSTIISNNSAKAGSGLYIYNGRVILESGTEIRNNTTTAWGAAGAYIYSGTLTMEDGSSIHDNTMIEGGTVIVRDSNAEFIMNGGEIYNNRANMKNKDSGAAVILSGTGSKFTMNGGSIHDNSNAYGSSVTSENSADVTLNGGEISNNTNDSKNDADINTSKMTLSINTDNYLADVNTKVSLSFGYENNSENDYQFYVNSNNVKKDGFVGIRFGAMIPVGKWNAIKTEVKSIGVEYSKLGAARATKEVLKDNIVFANEDGTDVGNAYAAYTVRMIIDLNDKDIESTAQAFVRKTDDSVIYLGDARTYSVKTLSEEYISKSSSLNLDESTIGALEALVK